MPRDWSLTLPFHVPFSLFTTTSQSTIINLLLRFYDPQSGRICLDGHDIKALNIRWLRHQIGYVGQEPILFAGTVADNIAYGLPPEMLGKLQ